MQRTFDDVRKYLERIRRIPVCMTAQKSVKRTVDEVGVAGVLKIGGGVYLVDRMHKYTEGKKWEWFELQLLAISTGEVIFLEWEKDDELELSLWTQAGLPLSAIGLTSSQLKHFDNDGEGSFVFDLETFAYEESDKATFYADCADDGQKFYYWDFSGSSGRRLIGVEDWSESLGDREYEVCIGRELSGSEVTILAMGGESHA